MKIASCYGINDIRCEDAPVPSPGPGELLIKMMACGLCGTDISKITGGVEGPPAVLGHEIAGEVVGAGEGADGFYPGDRVVAGHHVPCFVCKPCRRGHPSQCDEFKVSNIFPGGFSEFIIIRQRAVEKAALRIPARLSYEEACFTETLACCLRAYERAGVFPGDTVMITGMGPVGLLHLQLAPFFGAARTIAVDRIDSRLKKAAELGADVVLKAGEEDIPRAVSGVTGSEGADVVIMTAGSEDAFRDGFASAAAGGTIVVFAGGPRGAAFNMGAERIYRSEITVTGSYSAGPAEQSVALELINSGKVKVKPLVTHRFKLSETAEAVALAVKGGDSLKIIIYP